MKVLPFGLLVVFASFIAACSTEGEQKFSPAYQPPVKDSSTKTIEKPVQLPEISKSEWTGLNSEGSPFDHDWQTRISRVSADLWSPLKVDLSFNYEELPFEQRGGGSNLLNWSYRFEWDIDTHGHFQLREPETESDSRPHISAVAICKAFDGEARCTDLEVRLSKVLLSGGTTSLLTRHYSFEAEMSLSTDQYADPKNSRCKFIAETERLGLPDDAKVYIQEWGERKTFSISGGWVHFGFKECLDFSLKGRTELPIFFIRGNNFEKSFHSEIHVSQFDHSKPDGKKITEFTSGPQSLDAQMVQVDSKRRTIALTLKEANNRETTVLFRPKSQ